ncbi:NAD(P)-dependent oxidoreductase [Alteraurantiacibacter buctensis]|uniref:NAD-binding protein n=1 Tax=Alteraurantiacibacter buctensis TaxID=1503981 RepID=A0A844Z1A1_9SPHN|nr:NAD(P)-dependent oxidoreductase [Alteraurantiacibacter buctensis]MXO72761.1 NAD-binding protein [Alteraurantiacibacter buctensis]
MTDCKTIAFLGLGVMGGPMAAHLARAGHRVTSWNRSPERGQAWLDRFAGEGLHLRMVESMAVAVRGADMVLSCLGNDQDVAGVLLGDRGALALMAPGTLLVDHTTISPAMARRIAVEAEAHGVLAVDAPVSGGQAGAENGKLAVMCGGTEAAVAAALPVMQAYAARIVHLGPAGAGQGAKAVNQVCIAGTLAGLSEGLRLAQASGLDTGKVLEAIGGGAAQSWQMDNRWTTMARDEFDFGFAIDWMRKDLAIALAEAGEHGLAMPVAALVDGFYETVQAMGGGRQDTSALVRHIPRVAG